MKHQNIAEMLRDVFPAAEDEKLVPTSSGQIVAWDVVSLLCLFHHTFVSKLS